MVTRSLVSYDLVGYIHPFEYSPLNGHQIIGELRQLQTRQNLKHHKIEWSPDHW